MSDLIPANYKTCLRGAELCRQCGKYYVKKSSVCKCGWSIPASLDKRMKDSFGGACEYDEIKPSPNGQLIISDGQPYPTAVAKLSFAGFVYEDQASGQLTVSTALCMDVTDDYPKVERPVAVLYGGKG